MRAAHTASAPAAVAAVPRIGRCTKFPGPYLERRQLESIIPTYADFIGVPLYVNDDADPTNAVHPCQLSRVEFMRAVGSWIITQRNLGVEEQWNSGLPLRMILVGVAHERVAGAGGGSPARATAR